MFCPIKKFKYKISTYAITLITYKIIIKYIVLVEVFAKSKLVFTTINTLNNKYKRKITLIKYL